MPLGLYLYLIWIYGGRFWTYLSPACKSLWRTWNPSSQVRLMNVPISPLKNGNGLVVLFDVESEKNLTTISPWLVIDISWVRNAPAIPYAPNVVVVVVWSNIIQCFQLLLVWGLNLKHADWAIQYLDEIVFIFSKYLWFSQFNVWAIN